MRLLIPLLLVFASACTIDDGIDMAGEVQEQTLTGQNAIEQYEWFKNR